MKSKSIKLTGNSYAVLALLAEFGDSTSYEIKQWLERSIENFWPVPHTTAYEEPARLASAGYLASRQEEGGRRRRVYTLTGKGREVLAEWAATPGATPPQLRDEAMLKVFAGADPMALARERREWHESKLAELSGYLETVRQNEGYSASEPTLVGGISYHRAMLELLDRLEQDRG
ncbi:MAG TPA: PadR family transcriptional regulator [Solirubrobacterales bacterium]|nr:PadR family transcriptional regulator [Solirubrobacterales bacterium]